MRIRSVTDVPYDRWQIEDCTIRRMRVVVGLGISLLLMLTTVPVVAHHAFAAEFDANKPLSLTGTVTKMEWINPHAWIHVEVTREDGTVEQWMIEGGTPNTLFRRGITRDSLIPGTTIVIDGYQAKDGSFKANGRSLTLEGGGELFLGSSGTGAPRDGTDPVERRRPPG